MKKFTVEIEVEETGIEGKVTAKDINRIVSDAIFDELLAMNVITDQYTTNVLEQITMPEVKGTKKNGCIVTVSVGTEGLDEALVKSQELVGVLQKIDGLTGRISRDIDKINRYALGKSI